MIGPYETAAEMDQKLLIAALKVLYRVATEPILKPEVAELLAKEAADVLKQAGVLDDAEMTVQEANARTLGLLWRIGEGIGPDVD